MIETKNIIITNLHVPLKDVLRVSVVSNITDGRVNEITNSRSIIRTTIDDIIIYWLCRKYGISLRRSTTNGELADICGYMTIKNILIRELANNVEIVNIATHSRRVWYSSYLINTTLCVVIRSCNEFN